MPDYAETEFATTKIRRESLSALAAHIRPCNTFGVARCRARNASISRARQVIGQIIAVITACSARMI